MNRDDLYHKAAMTGKSIDDLLLPERCKELQAHVDKAEKEKTELFDEAIRQKKRAIRAEDRVKELEAENTRLKRMYAELALDNAAMKDLIAKKL